MEVYIFDKGRKRTKVLILLDLVEINYFGL
jgi:hypothetical protein